MVRRVDLDSLAVAFDSCSEILRREVNVALPTQQENSDVSEHLPKVYFFALLVSLSTKDRFTPQELFGLSTDDKPRP